LIFKGYYGKCRTLFSGHRYQYLVECTNVKDKDKMGTDFLYARPSFSGGMATAMDLCGVLVSEYNRSPTTRLADYNAIRSDWAVTGKDFSRAIEQFNEANNVEIKKK